MSEEDEVIREALESGTDLREYSLSVEKELRQLENLSIHDYIDKSENIVTLHHQITECDSMLENMQTMLEGYLRHLSSISQEIQSLQEESASINDQLSNRKATHKHLSKFIDKLMVPEIMIHHILNTPVTESPFLEQLEALDKKIKFLKAQQFRDAQCVNDVQDIIDKLTIKAVTKIREYLLQKIYQFRKPLSNYQIPQNAMIKHKYFFEFLLLHARTIAGEINDEYVDTMSKVYISYFQAYTKQLWKLQYEEGVTKDDLMGLEENRGANSYFARNFKSRGTVFTLGKRDFLLTPGGLTQDIIVPHTASKDGAKYPFEVIFRSQQYALADNSCREFIFVSEFFMVQESDALKLFNAIMGKSCQHVQKEVCGVVMGCYDSIGLYLCLHLIHQYRFICHKRAVAALDNHWEQLIKMIWPRFEYVVRINIQSIQECDPTKMSNVDMRPHHITRRYAEFSGAVNVLQEKFPIDGVDCLMIQLQDQVEQVTLKMAALFAHRKEQLIFLINNYDMMFSVISEKTKEDSRECERLKELLSQRTTEYIEEVLAPYFGGVLTLVRDMEPLLQSDDSALKSYESKVGPLAKNFKSTWQQSIEKLNNEVMQCFTNFRTGTLVLQRGLESLIAAHHSFNKILTHDRFSHLELKNDIVNSHHLIVEAKKYKPTF